MSTRRWRRRRRGKRRPRRGPAGGAISDRLQALHAILISQEEEAQVGRLKYLLAHGVKDCPTASEPGYRELLLDMPFVFDELLALSPAASELIRAHMLRTTRGMAGFLSRVRENGELWLEDVADLQQYAYTVAGVVGEMLTELFLLDHPGLAPVAAALRERAPSFGEALQLVNLLKDSPSADVLRPPQATPSQS